MIVANFQTFFFNSLLFFYYNLAKMGFNLQVTLDILYFGYTICPILPEGIIKTFFF